jgi:hypothetical protein
MKREERNMCLNKKLCFHISFPVEVVKEKKKLQKKKINPIPCTHDYSRFYFKKVECKNENLNLT